MSQVEVATSTDTGAGSELASIATPSDGSVARIRPFDASPQRTYDGREHSNDTQGVLRKLGIPPADAIRRKAAVVNSLPIQIWEGIVSAVDRDADTMEVMLEAKMGHMPRHAATIALEWVPAQDIPLVMPGAIFYLTLYKQSERSTVRNAQEIRFRRMPSWTKQQIRQIQEAASLFRSSFEA